MRLVGVGVGDEVDAKMAHCLNSRGGPLPLRHLTRDNLAELRRSRSRRHGL